MQLATAPRRNRRTQAERSASTRARLLDAALDCLVEDGYAGTTTTAVADRAGVSRGAQLHHFPTRAALVAAAVQHLYAGLTAEYRAGFAALAPSADRLRAAIEILWSMFTKPRYAAVLELFVAARTDGELTAHLRPIAERHEANVFRLAREYFPEAARRADFDQVLSLVLNAMQGMAASRFVHDRSAGTEDELNVLHRIAAAALAPPARGEEPS